MVKINYVRVVHQGLPCNVLFMVVKTMWRVGERLGLRKSDRHLARQASSQQGQPSPGPGRAGQRAVAECVIEGGGGKRRGVQRSVERDGRSKLISRIEYFSKAPPVFHHAPCPQPPAPCPALSPAPSYWLGQQHFKWIHLLRNN